MRRLGHRQARPLGRQRQRRIVEDRRGSGCKAPRARRLVEDVGHGPGERVVQVHRREAQNLFDGAQEVERVVPGRDHRAPLHVGAHDVRGAAVRIDVVAAILRVVFNRKDQRVVGVGAVGNLLNQQADRIVVIGYLQVRSIHAVNRHRVVSSVIVHEANQGQRRQIPYAAPGVMGIGVAGVEVPGPLLVTPIIRKRVVETAEERIGEWGEFDIRGVGHGGVGRERVAQHGNGRGGGSIEGAVD